MKVAKNHTESAEVFYGTHPPQSDEAMSETRYHKTRNLDRRVSNSWTLNSQLKTENLSFTTLAEYNELAMISQKRPGIDYQEICIFSATLVFRSKGVHFRSF